jgi:hypothetical protein
MRTALGIVAAAFLGACQPSSDAYTLYRDSAADPRLRVHVATFDAADGDAYNRDNCRTAADLVAGQPGVTVRYWCEKGRFRA